MRTIVVVFLLLFSKNTIASYKNKHCTLSSYIGSKGYHVIEMQERGPIYQRYLEVSKVFTGALGLEQAIKELQSLSLTVESCQSFKPQNKALLFACAILYEEEEDRFKVVAGDHLKSPLLSRIEAINVRQRLKEISVCL
ncbi:hypothetical protein N9W41_00180 [bacterium]|nr:hypothetical protein [bacterium]